MLRWSFALAAVPAIAIAIASNGGSKPPPSPPESIAPLPVVTQVIRSARLDDETFSRRWQWVFENTPAIEQEVRPATSQGRVADAVPVEDAGRIPRSPRHRLIGSISRGGDVCARHGMHRVSYTKPNGWKYWRCRR